MQQAAAGQGLSFDPLPFEQDRLTTSKVDVGGGEIAQALMSAGAIVVLHKGTDLRLQSARPAFTIERSTQLEKRQALKLWAEHIRSLVDGTEAKVVSLRPRDPAALSGC
jgi:hypothetical protein